MRAFVAYVFQGGAPYSLKHGSAVSFWLVAIPGTVLERVAAWLHIVPGTNLWNGWQWTSVFPYSLFACFWSLVGMGVICRLLFLLVAPRTVHRELFAWVTVWACFHFPWFKAVAKILKYDSMYFVLSTISVLIWFRSGRQGKHSYWAAAWLFATLAFLEKESGLTLLGFLFVADILRIGWTYPGTFFERCREVGSRSMQAMGLFLFCIWVLSPVVWTHPRAVFHFLASQMQYLPGTSRGELAICVVVGTFTLLWLALTPRLKLRGQYERLPWRYVAVAGALSIFFFAWSFQRNSLFVYDLLASDMRAEADLKHAAVGSAIYGYRLTALIPSLAATRLVAFLSEWRVLFYSIPENMLWLALASICLVLRSPRMELRPQCVRLSSFLGASVLFQTGLIAMVLIIFQARYLAGITFLVLLLVLSCFAEVIRCCSRRQAYFWTAGFFFLSIPSVTVVSPTYFGYFNFFRDAAKENEDSKTLGALEWTWSGCGESTYLIQEAYLKTLGREEKPIRVLFDYYHFRPFASERGIEFVDPLVEFTLEERNAMLGPVDTALPAALTALTEHRVEFLILSKVRALTVPLVHHWTTHHRHMARYTESRRGVEYAWVFAVSDLKAQPISYNWVRASQSSGKKRFERVARR